MKRDDNIYTFSDINDWISYTANFDSKMMSPGGIANMYGISRTTVNNWIYRDGIIRCFRYGDKRKGEYSVIPMVDVEKVIKDKQELFRQRKTGNSRVRSEEY